MKLLSLKPTRFIFLLLVFNSLQLDGLHAQACPGIATLSAMNDHINLTGTDLCEEWTLDISDLGLNSEEEANKYFTANTDNITQFVVNWAEQETKLTIMLDYMPSWTLSQWQDYYQSKDMLHW